MEGTSSHDPSSSSSSSANSAAAAAPEPGAPDAEASSSMRTLIIFKGAGIIVYVSGSEAFIREIHRKWVQGENTELGFRSGHDSIAFRHDKISFHHSLRHALVIQAVQL